ncbi:6-carboxytetrahydropterin synthase [Effusibacillus dendaii]|uniref:6-carboxy-5,6,7,8-tetrahydropterin synthase n=1 Tax=Effusibacillus dendaii TaxID=2743772 RepID=A0A7I8D897_9BACL|nr:6-carboxytetrahydropterin synthase [Effusibacillus dendaii]BCJ85026.1 6-pyruvoyltetrahydropterin synthase [Effusibacillus dendaii]
MIYMSRRVDFSAAHVYRKASWSNERNVRVFGACSNPNGHGHDYVLEVMVRGHLDARSGIVVNIVDIDRIVKGIIRNELDGKFLDREHSYFKEKIPTTENIVEYLWSRFDGAFPNCELYKIRLQENPFLFSEKEGESMVTLTRKYHFSAAHRLHSDFLTEEENAAIFGKCNNPHGHGHNYRLEVTVSGSPDPETGMIVNLTDLDRTIERVVLDKFDHKHLNLDTEEFKNLNPTSEVVALVIWNMLEPHIPNLYKIGLWETEKNYFEYCGPVKE